MAVELSCSSKNRCIQINSTPAQKTLNEIHDTNHLTWVH